MSFSNALSSVADRNANTNDTTLDMIAPFFSTSSSTSEAAPRSLVSSALNAQDAQSAQAGQHPDHHWNGRRESLGSWLNEFETVLSTVAPDLWSFAVELFVIHQSRTTICFPGQAAQLDGALPRPHYDWNNPAPVNPNAYMVPDQVVVDAYAAIHARRMLTDPTAQPAPLIPPGTQYPVNDKHYILSSAHFNDWNIKLRNIILRYISDLPMRHLYARDYPRDGRALLDHLRASAATPLSTTQVNSVNADIAALTARGITSDTVEAFREFGVIYHRLLDRIPAANPSRDSPSLQAMRYMQATIKTRHQTGMQLMHHFAAHGVDQNSPAAVRDSIIDFLEENAAVRRLCQPTAPIPNVNPS